MTRFQKPHKKYKGMVGWITIRTKKKDLPELLLNIAQYCRLSGEDLLGIIFALVLNIDH